MNTKQSIFDKYSVEYESLKCIKRTEKIFNKYISKITRSNIFLDADKIKEQLNLFVDELMLHESTHVVILNENTEIDNVIDTFSRLCNFKVKKYKIGMFNNPDISYFCNATAVLSFHDRRDRAGILNAKKVGLKIYGLNNLTRGYKYFDRFVPINNFSINTLTLITWYIVYSIQEKLDKYTIPFSEYYTLVHG